MISAVIITRNEASRIEACLASMRDVADEVLVLDTGSEDETVAVARRAGATVFEVEWVGFAATKNIGHARAMHPWILSIDADERLSEGLREELLHLRVTQKLEVGCAYSVPRLTRYCGRWIRRAGWYPDRKIRLFPREARWVGEVHETLDLPSGTRLVALRGDLLHESIDSLDEHREKVKAYAQLAAADRFARGQAYQPLRAIFSPAWRFIRQYFLQGGFLEGKLGFDLCRIAARESRLKWRYLRELHRKR